MTVQNCLKYFKRKNVTYLRYILYVPFFSAIQISFIGKTIVHWTETKSGSKVVTEGESSAETIDFDNHDYFLDESLYLLGNGNIITVSRK
jgi:hypothetical protein